MSEVISILSLLVAGLASLYARWAAIEARKQNDITIHENRIEIYRGIAEFGQKLVGKGELITEDDIREFDRWVELSEFYFVEEIHSQLDSIYHSAADVMDKQDKWDNASNSEVKLELKQEIRGLLAEIRNKHKNVFADVKSALRIAKPENWVV